MVGLQVMADSDAWSSQLDMDHSMKAAAMKIWSSQVESHR